MGALLLLPNHLPPYHHVVGVRTSTYGPCVGTNFQSLAILKMFGDLLNSTENATPYSVIIYAGKASERMDTCIGMTASLCCTAEIITALSNNYTSMKQQKRSKKCVLSENVMRQHMGESPKSWHWRSPLHPLPQTGKTMGFGWKPVAPLGCNQGCSELLNLTARHTGGTSGAEASLKISVHTNPACFSSIACGPVICTEISRSLKHLETLRLEWGFSCLWSLWLQSWVTTSCTWLGFLLIFHCECQFSLPLSYLINSVCVLS